MNKEKQMPAIIVMSFLLAIGSVIYFRIDKLRSIRSTTKRDKCHNCRIQSNGSGAGNQTSTMAGLSQEDFNTLKDNLNAARDTVQDNDPAGAVSE